MVQCVKFPTFRMEIISSSLLKDSLESEYDLKLKSIFSSETHLNMGKKVFCNSLHYELVRTLSSWFPLRLKTVLLLRRELNYLTAKLTFELKSIRHSYWNENVLHTFV
jgi:hypothetical protein